MKLCYFDCFSGISGDMLLGALVDAGADADALAAELRKLPVPGWTLTTEKVKRGALQATKVNIKIEETHHHRGLKQILELIERAPLPARAAARAQVFIVAGTSAAVQPAASLPVLARQAGAKVVEVNLEATPLSPLADACFLGKSGEVLPRLVEAGVRQ